MSVELDFKALLASHAPLVALVGARIAQDAVPGTATYPLVVYSVRHDYVRGLDNAVLADQCSISTQCWANDGATAGAVADAVAVAIGTAPAARGAVVLDRATTFDPETDLDGVLLTVEWWA